MPAHIFIDGSNVYYSSREVASQVEPQALALSIRIYWKNLVELIERDHPDICTRVFASSVRSNEAVWDGLRKFGYTTMIADREPGKPEQAVDEALHLAMANTILDHDGRHDLVLVTGDGNERTLTQTSFPGQVERALRRGWNATVWSWSSARSGRWTNLHPTGGAIALRNLDPFYESITFVQVGPCPTPDGQVYVTPRYPKDLPRTKGLETGSGCP